MELKRFKQLLESTIGDVKPLLETSQVSAELKTKITKELESLENITDVKSYFSKLNQTVAEDSNKLVLIFPGNYQYYTVATFVYLFGINAQVFTSISDCLKVLSNLSSQGKKYSQIYIGSHGGGKEGLLYSIDEGDNSTLSTLIGELKKVSIPNTTKIIFSACGGADNGYAMKKIAELTNTFVYGSEGAYDWIFNESEGGFWLCPPNPKVTNDKLILNPGKGDPITPKYNGCTRVNSVPFSWS